MPFSNGKKDKHCLREFKQQKNTPGGKISANCKLQFKVHDTENDVIFTVTTTLCQINGEDCVNFCGLLRKHGLYAISSFFIIEEISSKLLWAKRHDVS